MPGNPPISPVRASNPVGTLIAWILIVVLAVAWIGAASRSSDPAEGEAPTIASVPAASQLAGRIVVASRDVLARYGTPPAALLQNADPLREGQPVERIAYAILVAELESPERGIETLSELLPGDEPSGEVAAADRELAASVRERLERWERDAPPAERALEPADAERLGYFAGVLAGSVEPSSALLLALMGFGAWYLLVALAGVVLLCILPVLAVMGKLPTRIATPSGRGGVYAETFALWMLLFLGINLLLGQVMASVESPAAPFLAGLLAMFGSLAALAWPVVRGVSFREVRSDIGLHAGRGPIVETLAGLGGYAIALPLLVAGAIVMVILTRIFEGQGTPSHPAVEGIASAGPLGILAVFLLACVAAPVVEEIMFRGVLYRHLRDATGRAGIVLSFAASAIISSVLFAAIHPQGLLFIPVLAGLAIGYCITRELRGSLWACMVAHALTNFVTVTLNVVLAAA